MRSHVSEKISDYTLFSKIREGKNGGGVAILVRDDIRNIVTPQIRLSRMWKNVRIMLTLGQRIV